MQVVRRTRDREESKLKQSDQNQPILSSEVLLFKIWALEKPWLGVRKSKRNWLTVERFSVRREDPVLRSRTRICSSFLVKSKDPEQDSESCSDDGISSGSRSRAWGLINRTGSPIQGFAATEKVIPTSACGSPSFCHPELVSGSGFDPPLGGDSEQLTGNLVFTSIQWFFGARC